MSASHARVVRQILFALIVMLVVACRRETSAPQAAASDGMHDYNVLLVTIDTLRADHLGAYGARDANTPALDRLAAGGIRFEHAQTAVPLTLPSHTTILSALLPQHHGIRNNGAGTLPDTTPTLATTLKSAGYRTGAFVGAFVLDHRYGLAHGFDRYDDEIVGDPTETIALEAERPAAVVADRAIQWLEQSDARPFFAWVHFYDPHAPYAAPPPYASSDLADAYRGEIAYVDSQLQRLLNVLQQKNLLQRTIVVVVGDHGEALGEHGEETHGLLLYEPTLRVPFILSAAGALPSRVVQTPVSLVDLAPTLSTLVGHPMSGPLDGRDLSGALFGATEPPAHDLYAETEYPTNFGWSGLAAVRRQNVKYIDSPEPELFDLRSDAGERTNVRDVRRRESVALAQALTAFRAHSTSQSKSGDEESRRKLASLGYISSAPIARASKADPKKMAPLFGRFEQAIFALKEGRRRQAVDDLQRLVAEDPANPVFLSTLARTQRREGDLEPAAANYRRVVTMTPGDADAWYNLAATLQESGHALEAAKVIEEALRLDPRNADAHNTRGIILLDQNQPNEALEEFRRATELDPRQARAYNNMGNVFRAMGQSERAEAAFRTSLAIAPDYADALNGLATILVQRDQPAAALPLFDRVLAAHPDFVEARLNRGIALQVMARHASAAVEYERVLRETRGHPGLARQREAAQQLLARLPDRVDHGPIR
jgi:arylsulfatase A-like enzyme/Tfp pilus assembly protein PilF